MLFFPTTIPRRRTGDILTFVKTVFIHTTSFHSISIRHFGHQCSFAILSVKTEVEAKNEQNS